MENVTLKLRKEIKLDAFNLPVKVLANSNIKKIIQADVRSVANAEENNGLVIVSGKSFVNVVFENQENVIESANATFDFSEKQKIDTDLTNLKVEICASLGDIEIAGGEFFATIKQNAKVVGVVELNLPVAKELEDDYVCKKKNFAAQTISDVVVDNFVVAEEMESNLKEVKILNSTASVKTNEVTCGVDKVVVEGTVFVEVLYESGEGLGTICKNIDFKQEILAERSLPNQKAAVEITLRNITVSPEEKDDKTTLVYAADLQAYVCVYDELETELIEDIYSLKSEIATRIDYVEFKQYISSQEIVSNQISQTDISEIVNFDDLVCVCNPYFEVGEIFNENGKYLINGKFGATAIYREGVEFNSLKISTAATVDAELEQDQPVNIENVSVEIVSAKVKAGKELEVNYKLVLGLKTEKVVGEDYVKSFDILNEKQDDDFGLKVYVTKAGQSVYDVAKILNVKPETILQQNREVDDIFESGQKVYVYLPINL